MALDNVKQFNREVANFAKKLVPERVRTFQKKLVFEALKRIVNKTPVDSGRAQGNWQVTIGSKAEGKIDVTGESKKETIDKGLAAIASMKAYDVIYITNNVNYIVYLEEGSSKQSPAGMVGVTLEELRQMFK